MFSCKTCLQLLHGCLFRLDGDLPKQFLHLLIKILQTSPRILIFKDHRLEPFGFYSFHEACVIIIFQNLLQVFFLSLLSRTLQSLLGTLLLVELMLYIFDLLQNCAEVPVLSVRISGSLYIFSARRMPGSPLHRLFVHWNWKALWLGVEMATRLRTWHIPQILLGIRLHKSGTFYLRGTQECRSIYWASSSYCCQYFLIQNCRLLFSAWRQQTTVGTIHIDITHLRSIDRGLWKNRAQRCIWLRIGIPWLSESRSHLELF